MTCTTDDSFFAEDCIGASFFFSVLGATVLLGLICCVIDGGTLALVSMTVLTCICGAAATEGFGSKNGYQIILVIQSNVICRWLVYNRQINNAIKQTIYTG